jgi:hypothetical protein
MNIKKVVVAGGGVLGSQIAYQSAFCGFNVTVWLRSEGSIERAKPKFERLLNIYLNTLEAMKTDKSAYCRGFSKTPDLSDEEIDALKEVALSVGLSTKEVDSMLNLGGNTLEEAYKMATCAIGLYAQNEDGDSNGDVGDLSDFKENLIWVHVCGQVNNPGVYSFSERAVEKSECELYKHRHAENNDGNYAELGACGIYYLSDGFF